MCDLGLFPVLAPNRSVCSCLLATSQQHIGLPHLRRLQIPRSLSRERSVTHLPAYDRRTCLCSLPRNSLEALSQLFSFVGWFRNYLLLPKTSWSPVTKIRDPWFRAGYGDGGVGWCL